jgi:hypothetical protein
MYEILWMHLYCHHISEGAGIAQSVW